jgi:glycosyltransferase involved in cell wall biosynthesis
MQTIPLTRHIRVLAVGQTFPPMVRPIEYLLKAGVEVICVSYYNPISGPQPSGFTFIPFSETKPEDFHHLLSDEQALRKQIAVEAQFLKDIYERYQCNIAHAFGLRFEAACCATAKIKPLVISIWGELEGFCDPNPPELDLWIEETLKNSSCILVEPPCLKPIVQPMLPANTKLHVWHPGVDLSVFSPGYEDNVRQWRRILRLPEDAITIFSPRGWGETYHHELVLQAFLEARSHFNRPAYLLFIKMGRSHDLTFVERHYQEIQNFSNTQGAGDFIRWLPTLPQLLMPPIYNLADLVISYKSPDTFPSTVIEALACQRQVIAPDLAIFKDTPIEKYALLVKPESPTALAGSIIQCFQNKKPVEQMQASRAALLNDYDRGPVTQHLLDIYFDMIEMT